MPVTHPQVHYVEGSDLDSQLLYVVTPDGEAPAHGWPLVVYVHGGGWEHGNFPAGEPIEVEGRPIFPAMLAAGYALAFVNYRLTDEALWPAQILDCKAAIRHLRAHAGEYGVDPARIAAYGSSSGAHLAQFLGVTNGDERYEDRAMGSPEASSDVRAVLSSYGISDVSAWLVPPSANANGDFIERFLGRGYTRESALEASPVAHVGERSAPVPMLLAHAQDDPVVNWDMTPTMERALRAAGGAVVSWYPPTGGHGHDDVFQNERAVTLYIGFLARYL
ncbi:alpha/beta hydrolase [Bifidobacterium sp. DSM 109958]|uniref:Alpha/beta hydrolase n=1 Tax=Bifidobacterium moraviense TaxID=2675323 RepID=A0A7Y0HZC5_9BIFI|nr:alpha/beta hydrolase [Bifidobacterium sp. DSM 109958]NMN00263.1 alpha/beta hydrolase [Bifidobacterium sp. DSM 109958]